ncbi:phosphatase PAP2 family protein [Pseudarthrobacter sp. N5]|uniref:phosphatase PAP2 family protein n=1 Tax=Pseudarthrobacter sp. N5 TaxID=3418416 RepID=UPI003CEA1CC1
MISALTAQLRPAPPHVHSPRALFFTAAALLAAGDGLFWLMFAAVKSGSGAAALDGAVHDGLVGARTPWLTAVVTAVTTVTSPLWMMVIGVLMALCWAAWRREIWRPALLLAAMASTVLLSALIKSQVNRPRPSASDFMLGPDDALSFPSGHTFGAGVFVCVLVYMLVSREGKGTTALLGWGAGVAVATTALVAFSRLYLGYHWLTDVLASMGLVFAVTGVVILVDGLRASRRVQDSEVPAEG